MYFYNILLADHRFRGSGLLTYHSTEEIPIGTVVTVPLRNRQTVGITAEKASRPQSSITTKSISNIVTKKQLPSHLLELIAWLSEYYPSSPGQAAQLCMPQFLALKQKLPLAPPEDQNFSPLPTSIKPELTSEQRVSLNAVRSSTDSVLLHGITGSGKTRVYIELLHQALKNNQSAIVLTPEIGLTPQLATALREQFSDRVVVTHSRMTQVERRKIWLQALYSSESIIIVGPRSSLFYPLCSIGLIIVDEAHDTSYKQEQMPHYHATHVAGRLAQLQKAQLVLGTATPTVVDYSTFQQKQLPIIEMNQLAKTGKAGVAITTYTINASEREHFTQSSWLADELIEQMRNAIVQQQQSLLYLNRRGTARLVACSKCAWQHVCPHCDSNLIYHGDAHLLRCHTCGSSNKPVTACPDCGNNDITYKSAGTKFIVDETQRLLPNARIARFDSDNSSNESLQQRYQELRDGVYDIAVGTRLIGKGLDLPKLSVLGILQADNALLLPDYAAEEELFQEIYQLLGRIGRGHSTAQAHAFIQTSQPGHPVIKAAVERDYQLFYRNELKQRQKYNLPPYAYLLVIHAKRASRTTAKNALLKHKEILEANFSDITIQGPAPAFVEFAFKKYHWRLLIKTKKRSQLIAIAKNLPPNLQFDIDPIRIL